MKIIRTNLVVLVKLYRPKNTLISTSKLSAHKFRNPSTLHQRVMHSNIFSDFGIIALLPHFSEKMFRGKLSE